MKKSKTHFSIRTIALLLALVLVVGIAFVVPSQAADTASLGKIVDYFKANSSNFTLNANSRFFLASEPTGDLLQVIQLAQRQFASDGIPTSEPMDIVWGDTKMLRNGDIYIAVVTDDPDIGAEGYKLAVENHAAVVAEDIRGLLYGLNQLQKHFRSGKSNTIKGFTTYDTPDTKERVVSLDCARKYLTKDWICNYIKEMSWMGYNTLQLHFSEDSGFRVDLWDEQYYIDYNGDGVAYHPSNDFSWICGGQPTTWTHTSTLTGVNYADYPDKNRFLSMTEVIEILQTCKEYHIDVIPSFDTPAHVDYLTWKYEQHYKSNSSYSFYSTYYGKTYKASDVKGVINYSNKSGYSVPQWPYYTCIDLTAGTQAEALILELYTDMANFFKEFSGSTNFSIGADEPNMTYNATWDYAEFIAYINRVNRLLNGKGYTVRMYNDFVKNISQFDSNIRIMYWNSAYSTITGQANAYAVPSVTDCLNNNRIVYNCINQHTYYVLRINDTYGDARSKTCYQWEFYGADEQSIWTDWTPNNIRKKGKYIEPDAIVPDNKLAGAYFLVWNDYAMVSTEQEMWNGVYDNAKKTGEFYSLLDRMWSNITKMWNWDVDDNLAYSTFATIRDSVGDFPGLGSGTNACSTKSTLPSATAPIHLADHTKLTAAVANKIAKGSYTDASYNAYLDAYNRAVLINNDNAATAEQLGAALTNLETAIENLAIKTNTITVVRRTTINGTSQLVDTLKYSIPAGDTTYDLFIPTLNGYKYLRTEGSTFTPAEAGDGSGYLSGKVNSDIEITMWYENQVDTSRLNNLLADAITEQGNYTDASWRVYSNALTAAKNFTWTLDTQQSTVLALVKALEDARTALVVESNTTFIKVEKLADSYHANGQIGLYIYTSSNVPGLTITENGTIVKPDTITGEVQTLTNGEIIKYWLVFIPAGEAGTYTYTVTYGITSTSVDIVVS